LWLALVFVLLPAVGYISTRAWLDRSRAQAQARASLLTMAQAAAAAQQQSLADLQRALSLAAKLAPIQTAAQGGDPAPCSARLAEIAALLPQTNGLAVWNLNGALLCADHAPAGSVTSANEAWFQQAVAQRAFAIGDFGIKDLGIGSQPIIGFGYPITTPNGQLAGVVSTSLDLKQFVPVDNGLPWPADAHLAVLDHTGSVLASTAPSEDWGGSTSAPDAARLAASLASGANLLERTGNDGVVRLYAYTPVTGPGGSVVYLAVARPAADVYGPADTGLVVGLVVVGGLTGLAFVLAGWWGRQTLVRPMQALLATAERLTQGDLTARARREPAGSEVERLAAAINTLAGRLEQGEADRNSGREAVRQAQQNRARAAQLEAVSASLSMPLTPQALIEVVLRQAAGPAGASAATLLLLSDDGGWLHQAASVGYSSQITRLFQRFPVTSPLPAADAVRTGEAVWIESAQAYRARYPRLTEIIDATDYEAAVALVLRYGGRAIGALSLSFSGELAFTDDLKTFLVTLASLCAQALERARPQADGTAQIGDQESPAWPKLEDR
jgi:HAMP domain-containing protein